MEPKKEKPKIALGYDNPETEDVEVIFFDSDDLIGSVITDAAIDPERLALTQLTLKLRDGRELLILPSEFEDIAVYYKGKIPNLSNPPDNEG